jgi:hypothetical protein
MKLPVTESGVVLPKAWFGDATEVEVRPENGRVTVGPLESPAPARKIGSLRGTVLYMAPDFDAPLEEFKEYVE